MSMKQSRAASACAHLSRNSPKSIAPCSDPTTLPIPWCTYTDPEIAHVGLYEHEAKSGGVSVRTFVQELAKVDRAVLRSDHLAHPVVHLYRPGNRARRPL